MALVRVLEGEELAGRIAALGALGMTKEQIAAAIGLPDAVIMRRLGTAGYGRHLSFGFGRGIVIL